MRRLEDDGVIRGHTIREAGIGLTALVRLKVGPGTEIGSLAGEFSTWAGVECVYEISGNADLVAVVHVDDTGPRGELSSKRSYLGSRADLEAN
jgi:DNA-binding Lrp family transcriptional regulator